MSGPALNLTWRAPGLVAARFMAAVAPIQIINGPVGSGKTTTAMMKAVRLATRQQPSSHDGVTRKFKLCCVRDTYRQIWKTTLPSWHKRFPKDVGDFIGSEGGPARPAPEMARTRTRRVPCGMLLATNGGETTSAAATGKAAVW